MSNLKIVPVPVSTTDLGAKILLIGDSGVGKTTLMENLALARKSLHRFHDQFVPPTIGIDFKIIQPTQSQLETLKGRHPDLKKITNIKYRFWDASGSERFRPIITNYYRELDALLVVCDLSNRQSFQNIEKWLDDFNNHGNQAWTEIVTILIGNKSDLFENQQVSSEELIELAEKLGLICLITSAKDASSEAIIDQLNLSLSGLWRTQIRKNRENRIRELTIQRNREQCCVIV